MAWVDSMRLRRKAGVVRSLGWINLAVTVVWSFVNAAEGLDAMGIFVAWATLVMAITHGVAWMIDRHAEHVVTR